MRLPLAAAVLAAATALPGHAAMSPPVCAVALVADAVGTSATCSTATDRYSIRADRWLDVYASSGTVDIELSCAGFGTRTRRVYAQTSAWISVSANTAAFCVAKITAVTPNPRAVGVSGFTPDIIDE